jgi:hypothetical protein
MTPVNGTGRKPGIGTGEDIGWELPFTAHALAHHRIRFDEVADGVWSIYFGAVLLGWLDERT